MNKEKQDAPQDILEEIKAVDQLIRRNLLVKVLGNLKYSCRKILQLRELVKANLAEMGISDEDAKRIIDFMNESRDVKLTEADIRKTREDARDFIRDKKKEVESGLEKKGMPEQNIYMSSLGTTQLPLYNNHYTSTDNITYATTTSGGDILLKDGDGKELSVKV